MSGFYPNDPYEPDDPQQQPGLLSDERPELEVRLTGKAVFLPTDTAEYFRDLMDKQDKYIAAQHASIVALTKAMRVIMRRLPSKEQVDMHTGDQRYKGNFTHYFKVTLKEVKKWRDVIAAHGKGE